MERVERKKREFQRREEEILAVTAALLAGNENEQVTVDRIASEVGIGKGTIYKHFKTKHEIVARLISMKLAERYEKLHPNTERPIDRLQSWCRHLLNQPQAFTLTQTWMESLRVHQQTEYLEDLEVQLETERLKLADLLDQAGCTSESRGALAMAAALLALIHGVMAVSPTVLHPQQPEQVNEVVVQLLRDLTKMPRDQRRVTVL